MQYQKQSDVVYVPLVVLISKDQKQHAQFTINTDTGLNIDFVQFDPAKHPHCSPLTLISQRITWQLLKVKHKLQIATQMTAT